MFLTPKIPSISYKILNPKGVEAEKDPKKIAQCIVDSVHLDGENYRLGNTKACNPLFISCLLHFCDF